jgi:hypothetical protein
MRQRDAGPTIRVRHRRVYRSSLGEGSRGRWWQEGGRRMGGVKAHLEFSRPLALSLSLSLSFISPLSVAFLICHYLLCILGNCLVSSLPRMKLLRIFPLIPPPLSLALSNADGLRVIRLIVYSRLRRFNSWRLEDLT